MGPPPQAAPGRHAGQRHLPLNGSRVTWPQVIFGDGGQSGFNAADTSISFHTYFSSQVDSNFRNNDPLYWVWISDPFFVAPQ